MKTLQIILVVGIIAWSSLAVSAQNITEIKIKTSAICEDCKARIENRLNFSKGVKSSNLDLANKEVTVRYDAQKTSPEKLRAAIAKAGYDADNVPADIKAYKRLPKCCKKPSTTN